MNPFWRWLRETANPLNARGRAWPHLALLIALVFSGYVAGFGSGWLTAKHVLTENGGYQAAPLPPQARIGGGPVPSRASLARYVVRIHNQGDSTTCVAQSGSEQEEIYHRFIGRSSLAFSPGFIANQTPGAFYGGMSYQQLYSVLISSGDAPLSAFPFDGTPGSDYPVTASAFAAASPYRFSSYVSVSPSDRYSIEYSIDHGIAPALAFDILSSYYNLFGSGPVTLNSEYGSYLFSHSQILLAYDPGGVTILNSWGAGWANGGTVHVTWQFLLNVSAEIVVPTPGYFPIHPPKPPKKPKPFPAKLWNSHRLQHHQRVIAYTSRNGLTPAARHWLAHGPSKAGGIVKAEQWNLRGRHGVDGFERDSFVYADLLYWPRHKTWHVKWIKHRRVK